MFKPPKQVNVVKSSAAFASKQIKANINGLQKINPKVTLGAGANLADILPIEQDSFIGGIMGDMNKTISGLSGSLGGLAKTVAGVAGLNSFGSLNAMLANPVTTTNGRNKLATVDPYKKIIETPQNQLSSILGNFFGTPGAVIGGIVENESLRKMASELIRTGKVDSATSKAFLKNYSNNLLAGVTEAGAPFLKEVQDTIGLTGVDSKQLLSSIMGIDGAPRVEDVLKQNPTISMIVKGKEYFSNADFSSVDGIFKVVDNLTSNTQLSSMFDLKTEFAIMNVVTKELMAFDAPDLFSKVGNWFRNDDKPSGNGADYDKETGYYLDNLENAISESSMTFMEGMLTRVPANKILDTNRNFVVDFLVNFNLRYDQEPSSEIGNRLKNLMDQIDPKWDKTQLVPGKGDFVTDLGPFNVMSNDACRVFMLADLYVTELTIANYYPEQPMRDYMKSLYPFAMI